MSEPSVPDRLPGQVAVVTDSAAGLPAWMIRRAGVLVVPLRLLAGGEAADDAGDGLPPAIEEQLRRGHRLVTSRPAPEAFAAAYREAAQAGATSIVSVHLSGQLSGTIASARLAAAKAPVPVLVVDSRSIGIGQGLVVRAAASAAGAGLAAAAVAMAAGHKAAATGSFFALDSMHALLAGGRLATGRPGPLACRPVLAIAGGKMLVLDRVRTRAAAADRLTELAAGFAAGGLVDIAVQHAGCRDRADELMRRLVRAIPGARPLGVLPAGAAIRYHTGPGMVGAAVAPAGPPG